MVKRCRYNLSLLEQGYAGDVARGDIASRVGVYSSSRLCSYVAKAALYSVGSEARGGKLEVTEEHRKQIPIGGLLQKTFCNEIGKTGVSPRHVVRVL